MNFCCQKNGVFLLHILIYFNLIQLTQMRENVVDSARISPLKELTVKKLTTANSLCGKYAWVTPPPGVQDLGKQQGFGSR